MSQPLSSQTRSSSNKKPLVPKTSSTKSEASSSSSSPTHASLSLLAPSSPTALSSSSSAVNVEEMRDFMKIIQIQLQTTAAKAAEDQQTMMKMMMEKSESDAKNAKVMEELKHQISVLQTKQSGASALQVMNTKMREEQKAEKAKLEKLLTPLKETMKRERKIENDEKGYIDVDEEEEKEREKERVSQEKEVFIPEDQDEGHLESYIKWAEKREQLYKYDPHHSLYKRRHTLLSPRGRYMEWVRTGFRTGFPVSLFGAVNNRWYRYFLQQHDMTTTKTNKKIRLVSDQSVIMPAWSYHVRDMRIYTADDESEDIPANSHSLSSLPVALRYTPAKNILAKTHRYTLREYGERHLSMVAMKQKLSSSNSSFTSSSSSSSSSEDEDAIECEKCGVVFTGRPYSSLCSSCEKLRKIIKKEKPAKISPIKMPSLEFSSPSTPNKQYDHEKEIKNRILSAVKRERNLVSSISPGLEEECVLGEVLNLLFNEGARLTMKLSRVSVTYTTREYITCTANTVTLLGLFTGDTNKAPQWLNDFCAAVYRHRFKTEHCIQILQQCLKKEAASWFNSNLQEVSLLPGNTRPIEALLIRFKQQYMGPTQMKLFRRQLQSTKLSKINVTVRELKQHYETFVNVANNMRLCDKYVSEEDLKQDFLDSLPRDVRTYIGTSHRGCINLDAIFQIAEESIQKDTVNQTPILDGEMAHKTAVNTMYSEYTNIHEYNENYDEYLPFNPVNVSSRRPHSSTSATTRQVWDNKNRSVAVCLHCGGKGHRTGKCFLIKEPQTLQGKAAWAERNKDRGMDYTYDKNYYINIEKQRSTLPTPAGSSSSSSSPSAPHTSYNRNKSKSGGQVTSSPDLSNKETKEKEKATEITDDEDD